MNKRLTSLKGKKTPTSCGEDRDGVYGKENRVYWLLGTAIATEKRRF
jgi:hypothetical protein